MRCLRLPPAALEPLLAGFRFPYIFGADGSTTHEAHSRGAGADRRPVDAPTPAVADEWPSRPVRMVNTFAAGGTADVLTRLVADQLSATFKQQFFVETRAARRPIGLKSVVGSEPDGYNLVLTNASHLVLHPIINPSSATTRCATSPTSPMSRVADCSFRSALRQHQDVSDFIDPGPRHAKPLTYSSSGLGSNGHLMTEFFSPSGPASRSSTCPTRARRRA